MQITAALILGCSALLFINASAFPFPWAEDALPLAETESVYNARYGEILRHSARARLLRRSRHCCGRRALSSRDETLRQRGLRVHVYMYTIKLLY